MRRPLAISMLVALSLACGTTHSVRPLGEGRSAVDLSVGGPLLHLFGAVIPTPMVYAGYTRGLSERSDAFARLHLFDVTLRVAGVEAGAAHLFVDQQGALPAISGNLSLTLFAGAGGVAALPTATATASWLMGARALLYLGSTQGLSYGERLDGSRGLDPHWAPFVGLSYSPERSHWTYTAELKWYAPSVTTEPLAVEWRGIGGRGALAPQLAISRSFGGDE